MFTSDDLEAAGQRVAQRPVESVPLLADLERELGKRRQSARLLGGMAVATAMLVGIGAFTLLRPGDDQVQIVAASPVPESSQVMDDPQASTEQRSAGVIDVDEAEREQEVLVATAGGLGSTTTAPETTVPLTTDGDDDDDRYNDDDDDRYNDDDNDRDNDDDDDDRDNDDDDDRDDDRDDDDDDRRKSGFAIDIDSDGDGKGDLRWGDWRHAPLLSFDIHVGDEAAVQAAKAAAETDETRTVDGRQVWIDRFHWPTNPDARSRQRIEAVTVSAWIDEDRFVQATGHAMLEEMLVEAVGSGNGRYWMGFDDEWDDSDRGWLPLPPMPRLEDWDVEDWDAIEDLKKQLEKLDHFDNRDD